MYYWTGNAAKARVIALVLANPRPRLRVFDYGAGQGGDWPAVLAAHPKIELVCYEPDVASCRVLRERVMPAGARVLSDKEFAGGSVAADCILSFSVLEHVFDRPAYMRHAKRHLAQDGTFYLNYDDGHFRTALDLDELRGWRASLAVTLQNRLAALWPRINRIGRYQARVTAPAIQQLVTGAGLAVTDDRYENLASLKALAKTMPVERTQDYVHFWLETEERLNRQFRAEAEPRMGDATNLWREMGSRTLELRHG